jgi:hypothetical protein
MTISLTPQAPDPLRTAIEARAKDIRAKIAARRGKGGYAQNVEHMQTVLAELEQLLATPEGEE